jgi:DNA-binding transcriptional LysR family regulator
MTLGSIDAIKQSVAADLGISAIPRSAIATELKYGLLKQLRVKDKQWLYPYNLIYHKNRYLSPAVCKLIELVRLRMKSMKY